MPVNDELLDQLSSWGIGPKPKLDANGQEEKKWEAEDDDNISIASDLSLTPEEINLLCTLCEEEPAHEPTDVTVTSIPLESLLFPYQKRGVSWLIKRERSTEIPSYWERVEYVDGRVAWKDTITKHKTPTMPRPSCGSILADEMGLGKTIQALGLLLGNPPEGQRGYPFNPYNDTGAPRCTLIVCPTSVVHNWNSQISKFVNNGKKDGTLSVKLYLGNNRENNLIDAMNNKVDVLLTTYQTLAHELRAKEKYDQRVEENEALMRQGQPPNILQNKFFAFDADFHRIILDEAHKIGNPATKVFKAAIQLKTERKLCLTGTPFVNRPLDIWSLLHFLEVEPLEKLGLFKNYIVEPIKDMRAIGLDKLRQIVLHVQLRRMKKDIPNGGPTAWPKRDEIVKRIAWKRTDKEHREMVDAFYRVTRAAVVGVLNCQKGGVSDMIGAPSVGVIFGLLTHVRRSCSDLSLVPTETQNLVKYFDNKIKGFAVEEMHTTGEGLAILGELFVALRQSKAAIEQKKIAEAPLSNDQSHPEVAARWNCAVCSSSLTVQEAVAIPCKHIFCAGCLDSNDGTICPICGESYTIRDICADVNGATPSKVKILKAESKARRKSSRGGRVLFKNDTAVSYSPKIKAMLKVLATEVAADEKVVLFSQWTSFLDIIEAALKLEGHTYTRIDGSTPATARMKAMQKFDSEECDSMETPRILLCTIGSCSTGINLTRGNVVFLMDAWWNRATENQAMDRVNRIGQLRDVRVYRFVMENCVEEYIIDKLQVHKATLGKGSIGSISKEELKKARPTYLLDLFKITEQDLSIPAVWNFDDEEEDEDDDE